MSLDLDEVHAPGLAAAHLLAIFPSQLVVPQSRGALELFTQIARTLSGHLDDTSVLSFSRLAFSRSLDVENVRPGNPQHIFWQVKH